MWLKNVKFIIDNSPTSYYFTFQMYSNFNISLLYCSNTDCKIYSFIIDNKKKDC